VQKNGTTQSKIKAILMEIKKRSMGSHQSASMISDTWLTPPEIIQALGPFDLDPCTPEVMPWATAAHRFTPADDGLLQEWFGRVWLNPPYSREAVKWLRKLSGHGNGIALTFARTETDMFFREVWEKGDAILFLRGRLHFHLPDGTRAKANAGAPSCLIAYGMANVERLEACSTSELPGRFLPLSYTHVIVVGVSPSWFSVVSIAVRRHGDNDLRPIYEMVERMAPDKVAGNQHWKEKVRQKVQVYRKRNHPVA
jgi:hypothetical protein